MADAISLLYRLVSCATDELNSAHIDDANIPEATRNADGFDRHFISKEATKMLRSMLQDIVPTERITTSFKTYLLEVAIRSHSKLQGNRELLDVASSLRTVVIRGAYVLRRHLIESSFGVSFTVRTTG